MSDYIKRPCPESECSVTSATNHALLLVEVKLLNHHQNDHFLDIDVG